MKRLSLFLLIGLFFYSGAYAQYTPKKKRKQHFGNQRLHKPLFKWVTGDYSKHGIQLSFGPTYTFTSNKKHRDELLISSSSSSDTLIRYAQEAKGRIGIFAEIGMVHIAKKPNKFVHYYDWGIGYKLFGGKEINELDVYDDRDTLVGSYTGEGKFYNGYLYARGTAHNVFQINPHFFLDNGLGLNIDYMMMMGNTTYDGYRVPTEEKYQEDLNVQLHYSLGLGIKPRADKGFFFVPSIEIPVLGIHEWNGGTPAIHWFSSQYFPAMLRLKFVWLFKRDPNRCPPVETNEVIRTGQEN